MRGSLVLFDIGLSTVPAVRGEVAAPTGAAGDRRRGGKVDARIEAGNRHRLGRAFSSRWLERPGGGKL